MFYFKAKMVERLNDRIFRLIKRQFLEDGISYS
jgi:hypothetical protein